MFPVTFNGGHRGLQKSLGALYDRLGIGPERYHQLTTDNAASVGVNLNYGVTELTTDGTGNAAQVVTIADGDVLGQRVLIRMKSVEDGSDTVVINANLVDTSITFDADDEEVLLEFDGADWKVVLNNGTTVA